MPTADLDDSAGWANWLQGLLANQGAAQPYGPGGAPGPYSGGPNGLMPGGQVLGYHGTTPGQPSMGYPAVGQAAGRPSVAPGMQQPARPYSPTPMGAGNDGGFNNPYQAAANAPMVPPSAGADGGFNNPYQAAANAPAPMSQGGIGSDARFPIAGPLAAPASGPIDPSIIARQKLMKPASPAATATAPPSAAPNGNRFGMIDRPNMSATGYNPGAPKMTALDLARLFGRA